MKIDQATLNKWKILRDRGDLLKISENTGISRPTLIRAFNEGICNEATFTAMSEYYQEKKVRLQKLSA